MSQRSIPARAGQPTYAPQLARRPSVYPRACGATLRAHVVHPHCGGLSPRVRGNPDVLVDHWRILNPRVYPRACGATLCCPGCERRGCGLSPRVRGNRHLVEADLPHGGSIPARAGQPLRPACTIAHTVVYPRACGATAMRYRYDRQSTGLSPRVRGNRRKPVRPSTTAGSIPARAGQPWCRTSPSRFGWVYPRACGATFTASAVAAVYTGLSPRVRGNHISSVSQSRIHILRSIPARAGQPRARNLSPSQRMRRVYPRACGATCCQIAIALSTSLGGSIPARAGQP